MNCPHCGSSQLYTDKPYICCLDCGFEINIEVSIVVDTPPQVARHSANKGRPKDPKAEERRKQIKSLKKKGLLNTEIGRIVGVDQSYVGKVLRGKA
jgi:hypothetical protein